MISDILKRRFNCNRDGNNILLKIDKENVLVYRDPQNFQKVELEIAWEGEINSTELTSHIALDETSLGIFNEMYTQDNTDTAKLIEVDMHNSVRYAGYQYDAETGLYYLNARMYDPKIARFLQEDTYRGNPNDPLSLNLYTYCRNNPIVYWDPTGHKWVRKYEGSILDWYWEKEYRYEGSQLCEIPRTLDDDILGDLLKGLDKTRRGDYYRYYVEAVMNGSQGRLFCVDPVQAFNFDRDADNETLYFRYQYNAVKQVRESGIQYINGLDLSGYSFEQYINIMGPVWEINSKYRTIDDDVRDAKICAAIFISLAAGYLGPYAASAAYTAAVTNPTGIYILTHAEPIVYGTIGVVGGSISLVNNIEEEDYIGSAIDALTIGCSAYGLFILVNDYNTYINYVNSNIPSNINYSTEGTLKSGVLDNANFAQKTYGSTFSKDGIKIYSDLAGKPINTVDDLASALKNGTIKPSDVPIDYIVRDGNTLILNTRSSQALTQAGIPRSQWNAVNQTENQLFEDMLTGQLSRNGLTSAGTPTVRMSGGNK